MRQDGGVIARSSGASATLREDLCMTAVAALSYRA
jgi:hypothetical protein